VSDSQSSIRQLHDQVSVLEAEAARPKRRRLLPHAALFVAAVAVGAASAGVSHRDSAAHPALTHHVTAHRFPARPLATARVAHLIDAPAERARALPVVRSHRTHVAVVEHRVLHDRVLHDRVLHDRVLHDRVVRHRAVRLPVVRQAAPAPVTHVAPTAPVVERAIAHRPSVPARHAAPVHRAAPARTHAKPSAAPKPVGIGPVVVTTSEEPEPNADGTSPTTAP